MASAKFRFPVLTALVLSGGTAHRQEIFKLVEKLTDIAPEDHCDWTNTASHQLSGLRDLGYVERLVMVNGALPTLDAATIMSVLTKLRFGNMKRIRERKMNGSAEGRSKLPVELFED